MPCYLAGGYSNYVPQLGALSRRFFFGWEGSPTKIDKLPKTKSTQRKKKKEKTSTNYSNLSTGRPSFCLSLLVLKGIDFTTGNIPFFFPESLSRWKDQLIPTCLHRRVPFSTGLFVFGAFSFFPPPNKSLGRTDTARDKMPC